MGFLDDIFENKALSVRVHGEFRRVSNGFGEKTAPQTPAPSPGPADNTTPKQEQRPPTPHRGPTEESGRDLWQPTPAAFAKRDRILSRKPERLSFLGPCPICEGRAFIHIVGGGFVCRTCQPGFFGQPVEAAGPDRRRPEQHDHELLLANSTETAAPPAPSESAQTTGQQRQHFADAWPWIKENKGQLLAAGWTMAALVRRSRYRWPYGPWGLAWLPVWSQPGVVVTLGRNGEIVFTYQANGRTINQAAKMP